MNITLTREEAQQVLDALVFATPSGYGPTEVYKDSIVLLQNRLAKETPYEVGQRLYRQGLGISDIPTAVYSDSDIAEAYLGFEAARLSAPEPEPVAKFVLADGLNKRVKLLVDDLPIGTLFYTTPPQREWQGLTDEEMSETYNVNYSIYKEHVEYVDFVLIYRAIEAKLKEKNHE
jgi:hypothetical protein